MFLYRFTWLFYGAIVQQISSDFDLSEWCRFQADSGDRMDVIFHSKTGKR